MSQTALLLSIPSDVEIVVSVAFRVRLDKYAQNHGHTERYNIRTPEELEAALDATHEVVWQGTLETLRLLNGKGERRAIDIATGEYL